jgi:hypothetical protein
MNVSGQFNLHFSFGCSSSYGTSTVTFNTDGTFSTGDGFHGKWSQTNGNIIWRYDGDSALYAGVVNGGAIVGNMINFSINAAGCFYCNLSTIRVLALTEVDHDSTGAKKKK